MKSLTLTLSFLVIAVMPVFAQKDTTELDRRNGFKDIKLGMVIDSLDGIKFKKEFKERDEFPAKLYSFDHPAYKKIGEVDIKDIELKAYKSLLYEINIVVDKDPRLMKALESVYGKSAYDIKNQIYFWKTDNLLLRFKAHGKNHLELMYHSFIITKMMKTDKEKKVDDIANDF
jgi:hypothetical protein